MNTPTDPTGGDGRNIDPRLGALEGEAAGQKVPELRSDTPGMAAFDVWRGGNAGEAPTYFERPLLKQPVWIWAVPAYFVLGGVAGAAATLAAAARVADATRFERLIRRCHVMAAAGTASSTTLLIYDLGRPERFANMLRVIRPTSVMNMGSWLLAASASSDFAALFLTRSPGFLGRVGKLADMAAGALGLPLAGYTGVLLSDTAVPLWRGMRRTLAPLFLLSGIDAALSFLNMTSLTDDERRLVGRLGTVIDVTEVAMTVAAEREASRVEEVGAALKDGPGARLWKLSTFLTVGSLALSLLPIEGRATRLAQGVLGVTGSVALKTGVFEAGKASALNPLALFEQQRAQLVATEGP
jgi:formate-dependent nitrite reductase membrane component NrfD